MTFLFTVYAPDEPTALKLVELAEKLGHSAIWQWVYVASKKKKQVIAVDILSSKGKK